MVYQLCDIYRLENHEYSRCIVPAFPEQSQFWGLLASGYFDSGTATQTDICHLTLRYFIKVLGTGPGVLRSGEPGFLLAGILGTGVPSSGDPETGLLPGFDRSSLSLGFLAFSFLIVAIHWIGTISIMSKRSSSSIPTTADRARLKRRMESPVSRSDSSSEAGEGSDCNLMAPFPLSCVYANTPLVVHASRSRASSYIPGEIAVYEAFFDSGLRGTIPALIAGLCNLFEISPSQLNPPAWRILIAIQNLGDLEYLSLGINEVLFAYHLAPLNVGEGRFHLRPRSGVPTVEELPKSDRKGPVFNKKWQERYAIMMFPGSSYRWNFIAGTHHAPSERERAVLRARQLPVDRRQVNFLVWETVLQRSSLWRDMSGGNTNDPFAAYQEAAKVMSAKKGSSSRNASGDEVMITGSRRLSVVKLEPSPSLPGKRPKSGGVMTRSAQQTADMARSAGSLAVALSNLNLNVFPQDGTVLPIGDPSEVVQVLQGGILRTVSQLYHLRERLSSEDLPILREEIEDLKRQVLGERNQRAARELEVHDLKDKVKDLEKVAKASSADALTTSQKNQELGEEIDVLKAAAETFKFEMVMAVNGARVVARWELMREWLRKQSAQWDLATTLEQYKATMDRSVDSLGTLRSGGDVGTWRFSNRFGDRWLEPGHFCDCGWTLRSYKRTRPLRPCRNPEVWIWRSLFGTRRFFEVVMTPLRPRLHRGTLLRLPRQDCHQYLFGFRILPLGSWPLSSSYVVFYFWRKSLTCLEGDGVGVMTQVPGLRCFPRLEKQDLDCSLYFTVLL
ncbi:hypothetical protein F2Q69_00007043 [Brassica cretica]|uniref:Uncharacterized protein n=1 Tax=Brassica cretica TaxID=69181 RepID=A0A8S9P0B8_BRACR|nr:hypothetical protein F2Q69_00007043 [Brassica cretica]